MLLISDERIPIRLHGWVMGQQIHQISDEVLQVARDLLYPALHKLVQQGWIEARWKPTENNRRAKYYLLTKAWRIALAHEAALWERLSAGISGIVRTADS